MSIMGIPALLTRSVCMFSCLHTHIKCLESLVSVILATKHGTSSLSWYVFFQSPGRLSAFSHDFSLLGLFFCKGPLQISYQINLEKGGFCDVCVCIYVMWCTYIYICMCIYACINTHTCVLYLPFLLQSFLNFFNLNSGIIESNTWSLDIELLSYWNLGLTGASFVHMRRHLLSS